jgi:hypothetical protein
MPDKYLTNRVVVGALIVAATLLLLFLILAPTLVIQFRDSVAGVSNLKELRGTAAGCRFAKPNRNCSIALVADTAVASVIIKDEGPTSCTTYTEQPDVRLGAESWVLSFLITQSFDDLESGLTDSLPVIDQGTIPNWLRNYCQSHPLDTIGLASAWLVSDLRLDKGLITGHEITEASRELSIK